MRLVFYPGEGHGNRRAASRLDYNLRLLQWMEHYLKGPGGAPPPYELDTRTAADKEPTAARQSAIGYQRSASGCRLSAISLQLEGAGSRELRADRRPLTADSRPLTASDTEMKGAIRTMSLRPVKQLTQSTPTIEGAGVHLRRAFGFGKTEDFDPFLLFDDFRNERPDDYLAGFPWHPHRGIETITYVLAGTVEHGDSLGNRGAIGAGDVQWMTAGRGILHQEMPQGDAQGRMHGFQLWANLPVVAEDDRAALSGRAGARTFPR